MKLSSRLGLAGLLALGSLTIIVGVLLLSTQQMKRELAKNEATDEILDAAAALRYLTLEYVAGHEERTQTQWQLRNGSLEKLLSNASGFNSASEQATMADIRQKNKDIEVLFSRLVEDRRDAKTSNVNEALIQELEARSTGQIMNQAQDMIADAMTLSDSSRSGMLNAQRWAQFAVLMLGTAVILALVAAGVLMLRSVIQPLAKLRAGIVIIGAGNLDHRLDINTDDEIGDLARAFDEMTRILKGSTVSRNDLEQANETLQAQIAERKRAEDRFRMVVEAAPNAMIMMNREGRIVLVNSQTEKVFGYNSENLIDQPIEILIPQRFRERHPMLRTDFFAHPSTRSMGKGLDLYGVCKDGREVAVEIGLNPIESEEGILVLATIVDITERKRAENQLRELLEETRDTANILASSVNDILAGTAQIARATEETSIAFNEATVTVEEIKQTAHVSSQKAKSVSDAAQQAAQVSRDGSKSVAEAIEGMQRIHGQMTLIADSTEQLSEQTHAIGEIISAVNDLAEQSNLLAVNAAIEAARAGEQGRGFAIVAQEVKSLAEQSKQATLQVRSILGDIQQATNRTVLATEQGGKAVEAGVNESSEANEAIRGLSESIVESAHAATQIAVSAQQQLIGMDQLVLAMESIRGATVQNAASAKQAETGAQGLHMLGQKLQGMLARFQV